MSTISEADILMQVVEPTQGDFPPEIAQVILGWRFHADAMRHINDLTEKNRQETITQPERATLENYLRVGNFLNILQAKARQSLARNKAS